MTYRFPRPSKAISPGAGADQWSSGDRSTSKTGPRNVIEVGDSVFTVAQRLNGIAPNNQYIWRTGCFDR
jgi:hypothetical protein